MLKMFPVQVKAAGTEDGLEAGQFRALVSVFGNKDSMGDVVVPGAFSGTLQEWKDSGDSIPIYWSHQMSDPDMNVGWVLEAEETEKGLEVLGQLDLEEGASAKALQVYRLLKGRRVTQFSFAYDVLDGGPVEKDGDTYNELRELQLFELGPTPIGANQDTELMGVKADLKRGRVLSAKNEATLAEAVKAIQGGVASIRKVLSAVGSGESPEEDEEKSKEKASGVGPVTVQEPQQGGTTQEPSHGMPSVALLTQSQFEIEGELL